MKRSLFFLITAILSALAGSGLLFFPNFIAEANHWIPSPQILLQIRFSGALVLSIAALNFLVRNHGDSATLKAVFICNIVNHAINTVNDLMSYKEGSMSLEGLLPFFIGHLFIGGFSLYYLTKIKS